MATRRIVLVKNIDKEVIAEIITQNYHIGRRTVVDYQYREIFLDMMNYVFIVSDAYIEDWITLDLDFYKSIEEHDNFLINISKNYNTMVLFAYEQTTTGDTRFLALKNGETQRLIYQKSNYDYGLDRILMEENLGNKLEYEKGFEYPEIGEDIIVDIEKFKLLDLDDLQEMFKEIGYIGEKRQVFDEKYLHLEYLRGEKPKSI